MDPFDSTPYPESKMREVIKVLAPANNAGKKEIEESGQDWTGALTYLTQVLSQSKKPREGQLSLGEALKEEFTHPPLPLNQNPTTPTIPEVKMGVHAYGRDWHRFKDYWSYQPCRGGVSSRFLS